jgi:hypothetical protein
MSAALWLFFAAAAGSLLALRFRRHAAHEAELLKKTSQRAPGKTGGSSAIKSAHSQTSRLKGQKSKPSEFGRR